MQISSKSNFIQIGKVSFKSDDIYHSNRMISTEVIQPTMLHTKFIQIETFTVDSSYSLWLWTDRQTDRQTDRKTDGHGFEMDGQTDLAITIWQLMLIKKYKYWRYEFLYIFRVWISLYLPCLFISSVFIDLHHIFTMHAY